MKNKILINGGVTIVSLLTSIIFVKLGLVNYAIIICGIFICSLISSISLLANVFDKSSDFDKTINRIIKLYDSILVECENVPRINGKDIVSVSKIDDLVDAELELRKPIYYLREKRTCAFVIVLENEALVYLVKDSIKAKSKFEKNLKLGNALRPVIIENTRARKARAITIEVYDENGVKRKYQSNEKFMFVAQG